MVRWSHQSAGMLDAILTFNAVLFEFLENSGQKHIKEATGFICMTLVNIGTFTQNKAMCNKTVYQPCRYKGQFTEDSIRV